MEENNFGGIGVFNPAKDIAKEVTLQVLIKHRDATSQAREGIIPGIEEGLGNQKKINKVKGLYKMISSQREMINISRPIIRFHCFKDWKKRNEKEEDQKKNPFEKEKNDYNDLMLIKGILEEAELDMVKAEQTQSSKDDYLVERRSPEGMTYALTDKYYEMLNGLEDTYEKIYFMMVKYKIASTGIEEDELKTYRELEEEAIKRVVDA
jgi:hypothetical protein